MCPWLIFSAHLPGSLTLSRQPELLADHETHQDEGTMTPLKLLIADDHPIVLTGLRALIADEPDLTIVAEVSNGHAIPELVALHRPDILILDLNMPGPNPIHLVQTLHQTRPDLHIIALTMYEDAQWVRGLLMAGASGYVLKDEAPDDLMEAIRTVADGGSWVTPSLVSALTPTGRRTPGPAHGLPLTPRETEVLALVGEGLSNHQIADRLCISPHTVQNHLCSLYAKLGVDSRVKLARIAIERRLCEPPLQALG